MAAKEYFLRTGIRYLNFPAAKLLISSTFAVSKTFVAPYLKGIYTMFFIVDMS